MYSPLSSVVVVATNSPVTASINSKATDFSFAPILSSPGSCTPLLLLSEKTTLPIDNNLGVTGSLSPSSSSSGSTLPSFGFISNGPTFPSPSVSAGLPGSESGSY